MSETLRTIERVVACVDERLPYPEFMRIAQQQADAMPLEIVVCGVTYRVTGVKAKIEGAKNMQIATYTEVSPVLVQVEEASV